MNTQAKQLGGSPQQREAYLEYARAFSGAECDVFGQYYTDDVSLELPSVGLKIEGRDGIVGFYRRMFERVRESLTLHQLIADDGGIAADCTSRFTALCDAPDFPVSPLRAGEFITVRVFVHYTLRDGKISSIKVARAGEPTRPQR